MKEYMRNRALSENSRYKLTDNRRICRIRPNIRAYIFAAFQNCANLWTCRRNTDLKSYTIVAYSGCHLGATFLTNQNQQGFCVQYTLNECYDEHVKHVLISGFTGQEKVTIFYTPSHAVLTVFKTNPES